MKKIEKTKVITAFVERFEHEYQTLLKSAMAAHEAATHEESRAEDRHDTRATEASYLAKGQAVRVAEVERTLQELKQYLESLPKNTGRIQAGSLVKLQNQGKTSLVLFSREGGGAQVTVDGVPFALLTPFSPLGEELLDCQENDEVSVETKGGIREYQVLEIL